MSTEPRPVNRRPDAGPTEPTMSLALTGDGSAKLVTVAGEIDMSNAHLLTELVEFASRPPLPAIAVDLSAVRFFSAHGVQALLAAQNAAARAGVALFLRHPSPWVTHILAVTGALPRFELAGDTDGAAPNGVLALARQPRRQHLADPQLIPDRPRTRTRKDQDLERQPVPAAGPPGAVPRAGGADRRPAVRPGHHPGDARQAGPR
ncbi:STAS domain-containing protein [Micromonospora mangrovi]|uniref:STAS domain-containing protein n=2 Tax=Micromonospora TaxID=1873 RepID=A0AAU8HC04_9ACTN